MTKHELERLVPDHPILVDENGEASVMVYMEKFYLDEVIDGAPHLPHPAFLVGGRELDGIYISKFQNTVINGRAYSLPDVDPATNLDYDSALAACTAMGRGFHLMSAMEWGAVALWCNRRGWLPFGNTDLGKDIREERAVARVTLRDEEKGICRVATGTGPVEWSHNRRSDGIYDLCGNVWEWSGGIRLVYGELQVLPDNDAALSTVDQSAASDAWRAIDGKNGEWILPDGQGTTPNSLKLDYVGQRWQYVTGQISDSSESFRFCPFSEVTAHATVCPQARLILYALGLLPIGMAAKDDAVSLYANNGRAERMAFRGGRWGQGLNAGLFKTCFDDARSYAGAAVGFRSAYCEEP